MEQVLIDQKMTKARVSDDGTSFKKEAGPPPRKLILLAYRFK
jgi:hypothetical protein